MAIQSLTPPKHDGDAPKEERYNWPSIRGEPPRVKMIDKWEVANKDSSYQRDEAMPPLTRHQLHIARSFSWRSFGAIVCAERNGKLLVVDGQNRLMAVLRRDDVKAVPVVIIDTVGSNDQKRTEEARAFLELNGERRLVSANQRFVAGCVAKDALSLSVRRASELSGVAINVGGKKVGTTASVDLLRKYVDRRGEEDVASTLTICRKLCESSQIGHAIIKAVDYLCHPVGGGGRVPDAQFWEILGRHPQVAIEKAMQGQCHLTGMSTPRVLANGIIDLVNKKCRKHYALV
jgi:hypothetical protein